ncbi:titin homolog isoform X1 [Solea solea]|uniref:titin homolog isoform X1 n=1 Tax=Solea solea TaxID=90069 RepID=UPI002729BB63|nr:titin homolog isoform X1 [Solea solea]XP_058491209.1 titin homolog isoform X1 [Solea solea]XP_058491210.1 titin homolog isoform X1 [Solea solea]
MSAQVEVQPGEVGRAVVGGRLHLGLLTDSSNKSLIEINQSHIITEEPNKPVLGPKPLLSPRPFAVDRNTVIRPILAPKPQTKPRPESTRLAGYKPELPSNSKTQLPAATVKPWIASTNRPAPTSFKTSNKLNTGQTNKPVVQPFKPAPPFDPGDPSKPTPPVPAQRQKPGVSGLGYSRSLKKPLPAEWSGTTKKEDEKDNNPFSKGGSSITRAKSMGFLAQVGQEEEEKEKTVPMEVVPRRPQPRSSRPRPVSAIFLDSSTKTEAPVASPRWAERRPLSADLTSKFESIGLSLHRTQANTKENTPEETALPQMREQEKTPKSTTPQSADVAAKSALSDQSSKKLEETTVKEFDENKRRVSIKSRISLLLDSSPLPGTGATGQGSDLDSPGKLIAENEPPVGVKQLIKQLTVDTPPAQIPVTKPGVKPRPLPLDLTKRFSSERSPDLGSASLSEATGHHEISKDLQRRYEEMSPKPSDRRTFMDLNSEEQLQKASTPEGPKAELISGVTSKESGPTSEVHTVRASLFDNVVERHSVLMMDEEESVSKPKDSRRSPSFKRGNSEDDGTLVTATYKEPESPSSSLRVIHAFDKVQAIEENRAVSENVPSAQWEDKAMTLRSRRSEGSRPVAERTSSAQPQPSLAVNLEQQQQQQQPRYLRVGALPKWTDAGMEKGMLKESQREGDMDKDRHREAEQEDVYAAPKRLKTLQTEEQQKPRSTYFALTGQIQEQFSPVDMGANLGDMAVPFDNFSARSALGGSQGKILPVRRNPSLDDAFAKSSHEQVEELMMRSRRELRTDNRDVQATEELLEFGRKMELKEETEQHKAKMKELEREKQRQLETEKQAHLEFARLKERERQREFERQRQKAFEREKQEFEKKQHALEQQKQIDLENQRRQEMERQKQIEFEKQRLQEIERRKQIERENQRQQEMERQKQIEHEQQRLQEIERRKQIERENQWQQEKERQKQIEHEQQRLLEIERRKQIERENQRQQDIERQKQIEHEMERQKQRELERERQRQLEREMREQERQRQREEERQRELDKERQLLEIQKEKQRIEELERHQLLEFQKQKQKERERQQLMELEKQRLREKSEREEAEKIKQMALEQEMLRLKELEKERERQRERQWEMERQKEIEKEKQRQLERQRQLDIERQELENQRLRQRELEKERLRKEEMERFMEMEKRHLQEYEKQKQTERDKQILELEKQRLREKMEKEEAEKMRLVAKHQETERQRLKEKQKKEEQERARLESSPLKPQVLDLDSFGLRNEPSSKAAAQRSDPATRWKEPSLRVEQSYKPAIFDMDTFTSQTQHSPSKDPFPVSGVQGVDAGFGSRLQPTHERDISWKVPAQTSMGFSSPAWTASPQDPWELRPVEISVDNPVAEPRKHSNAVSPEQLLLRQGERLLAPQRHWSGLLDEPLHTAALTPGTDAKAGSSPGGVSSSITAAEQVWLPRELLPPDSRREPGVKRRSQELNRMRSRSVSRRSTPSSSSLEVSLSRMRSRSAHRERDRHSWVQQNQGVNGDEEGNDSETLVGEADSQYGTWETGLRTDDSLTPATPSSESNLSPSPRKPTPPHTPGDRASHFETDTVDGFLSPPSSDSQAQSFPDAPTTLLDTSVLRSRAQLGKKRAPRTRPTRSVRQGEQEGGNKEEWLYTDSTEAKAVSKAEDSDSENQPRGADTAHSAAASQPQRVALFPGLDPSVLKAQLKKRGESDCQTDGATPSPSQLSRSPKSPFLPRAARVLPPPGGKENGEEDSPQWLKELKSKKRLSQYETES